MVVRTDSFLQEWGTQMNTCKLFIGSVVSERHCSEKRLQKTIPMIASQSSYQ